MHVISVCHMFSPSWWESYQKRCLMQHASNVGGVNWKTWMQHR